MIETDLAVGDQEKKNHEHGVKNVDKSTVPDRVSDIKSNVLDR